MKCFRRMHRELLYIFAGLYPWAVRDPITGQPAEWFLEEVNKLSK